MRIRSALMMLVLTTHVACIAPFTALVYPEVQVRVLDRAGRPISGLLVTTVYSPDNVAQPVQVYARRATSSGWSSASQTDEQGWAKVWMPDLAYRVSYWVVPPLGRFPRDIPVPSFMIELGGTRIGSTELDPAGRPIEASPASYVSRYTFDGGTARSVSPETSASNRPAVAETVVPRIRSELDPSGVGEKLLIELTLVRD